MTNKPTGLIKTVKKSKDDKGYWNTIGTMWPTKNAKVHKIILDALPIDGVMFVTEYEEKSGEKEQAPDGVEG